MKCYMFSMLFTLKSVLTNRLTCRASFQTNCETYYKLLYFIFHEGFHAIHKTGFFHIITCKFVILKIGDTSSVTLHEDTRVEDRPCNQNLLKGERDLSV